MTPDELERELDAGTFRPVYLLVGVEHWLRDRALTKLTERAVDPATSSFNADRFVAGESSATTVLSAANLLPMMATRRLVVLRQLERWDGKSEGDGEGKLGHLEQLLAYAESPNPSTVLVLVAESLDGRRKLTQHAKKNGYWVACDPLHERELGGFVAREAKARGHVIDADTAALLAELAGPELYQLTDAVERLSLYVGPGQPIRDVDVAETITRLRVEDSWALVDAVRGRNLGAALAVLGRVYDPRDRGLPLLGAMAWSVRQMLRLQSGLAEGLRLDEAARRAGLFHPGRARELAESLRHARAGELERMLETLAEADLALKGSKRDPRNVLETAVMRLCRG